MKKEEKKELVVAKSKEKKEKKVVKQPKERISIFKRISRYFKGVGKEIKRIKWTSGKELVKYSIASVIFVLFLGIYFYGIDWVALLVRSLTQR